MNEKKAYFANFHNAEKPHFVTQNRKEFTNLTKSTIKRIGDIALRNELFKNEIHMDSECVIVEISRVKEYRIHVIGNTRNDNPFTWVTVDVYPQKFSTYNDALAFYENDPELDNNPNMYRIIRTR